MLKQHGFIKVSPLKPHPDTGSRSRRSAYHLVRIACLICGIAGTSVSAYAQSMLADDNQVIERVDVTLANPSSDPETNKRVLDQVRRTINVFPGMIFNRTEVQLAIARSARQASVAGADLDVIPGEAGGVIVNIKARLSDKISRQDLSTRSWLFSEWRQKRSTCSV